MTRTPVPRIIALFHPPWARPPTPIERDLLGDGVTAIVRHIRSASRRPGRRTLFIEGLGHPLDKRDLPDPYSRAIAEARRLGWKIVGLDRRSRLLASQRRPPYSPQQRYFMFDGRERDWPSVLARHGATSADLVVMHPAHVDGFLRHAGFPRSSVTWVHALIPLLTARRLTANELTLFKEDIAAQRMARRRRR